VKQLQSPVTAPGEARWFLLYATSSLVYRMFILTVICLFLIDELFIAGVLLAIWILVGQLAVPAARLLDFVLRHPALRRQRRRAVTTTGLALALAGAALIGMPLRSVTQFEGVIQPPEDSQLVAETDSFVESVLAEPGSLVSKGQPLVQLQNLDHRTEMAVAEARLRELSAQLDAARVADRLQVELLQDEIAALRAQNARSRAKLEALLVTSPIDGIFLLPAAVDLPGQFVRKGKAIGYVVDTRHAITRVLVTQNDLERVSASIQGIELRVAGDLEGVLQGQLLREVPQARNRLPSEVLSVEGGGPFVRDPEAAHPLATRERLFEFEIETPLRADRTRIGTRVFVRFDHGSETLYAKLQRQLRQLFLRRLNA
jgi:putative peptide zinc metalloprotease protein